MKRLDAQEAGLVRYNSGKPCRAGHNSDRYTSNGMCIECLREGQQKFRKVNRGVRYYDRPCAPTGLMSFRYLAQGEWTMLAATDPDHALQQVRIFISPEASLRYLWMWDGEKYVSLV